MRILAIRGENLASLAKPFEIDLTAEPLAGTGLFAITGDTGAGKSTILDALCVALYGEYPRVAVGASEKAPDPSGVAITAQDARGILRRGEGTGSAEVDFVGVDGIAYRVRWAVSRARGKSGGRLQGEQRLLSRLADGHAVAEGKTPVRTAVETATGLTFDQFRRTVLLAQGEFDAFLLANENNRADLLEKITGTEIYARISARVNAGAKERKAFVDLTQARRNQIGLMEPETRDLLAAERADTEAEATRQTIARDALKTQLAHADQVARAAANLATAETALAAANAANDAAASDRAELAGLEAVEPLRPQLEAIRSAVARQTECDRLLAQARDDCDAARTTAATSAAALVEVVARDALAEAEMQSFHPVWAAAERLDIQLESAAKEMAAAVAAAARADETVHARDRDVTALDARHQTLAKTRDATAEALTRCALHAPLADRATDIAARFEDLRQRRGERAAAATFLATAAADLDGLAAMVASAEAEAGARKAEREAVGRLLADRRRLLALIDDPARAERVARLGVLAERLRDAKSIADGHARAEANRVAAEAEATAATHVGQTASQAHAAAESDHIGLTATRTAFSALSDLAEATAMPQAVSLRSKLIAGQSCPVCGSTEHPFSAPGHVEAVLVSQIRQRRVEIDGEVEAAARRITESRAAVAEAAGRLASARRNGQLATTECDAARAAFSQALPALVAAGAAADFDLPARIALDAGTPGVIAALLDRATQVRAGLAGPLATAVVLRREIEDVRIADDGLASAIESAGEQIAADRALLVEAQRRHDQAGVEVAQLDRQLTTLWTELAPHVARADLTAADVERDASGCARRLQLLGDQVAELRARAAVVDSELHALAPQLASARSLLASAVAHAAEQGRDLTLRAAMVEELRSERATLLAGESTAAHRDRIGAIRAATRSALAASTQVKLAADRTLAAVAAVLDSAMRSTTDAGHALAAARRDFADLAGKLGLEPAAAEARLQQRPEIVVQLRDRMAALDRAVADAKVGVSTRRYDLDELLAIAAPAPNIEVARTQIVELSEMIEVARNRCAELKARLDNDDKLRGQALELAAEISEKRGELAIWQAVDAAIGSADGSRFRRFAQAVTLDQLVRLANEQLAALKPRYQLARGATSDLALHVVDRDMGDEVRAVRSLSGGERFLVSLGLALALSGLEGRQSFVDTLFIDEGFGSLDAETLDMAIDALETLQSRGRKVGVITHVAGMIDRIAVQVRVEKHGHGRSIVRLVDAGEAM